MIGRAPSSETHGQRLPCLTELSTFVLIGAAIGISTLLWLAILAVL